MLKALYKDASQASKLFQLALVFLMFTFFSIAVLTIVNSGHAESTMSMQLNMFIQGLGMFVLPALFLAFLWSEKPLTYLGFKVELKWLDLLWVFLLVLVLIPFVNLLSSLNDQILMPASLQWLEQWMRSMESAATVSTQQVLNVNTVGSLALNLLLIAVLPALGEELFFRGIVQRVLSEKKYFHWAIWFSALLFSAIHLQFYGFFPRMLLGALFGYLLLWSGSIWLPIFAHFINNAVVVIFYYLRFNNFQPIDLDSIGTGDGWWIGLLSAALGVALVWLLYRRHKGRELTKFAA